MTIHILCPECGEGLAEIYPFYAAVKDKYLASLLSKNPIDVDKIDLKPDILTGTDFILDALDIRNMCCRTHTLTNADFDV
jgi:DNA-directed RNA polymerase subunit N (RpoN/RPB10)